MLASNKSFSYLYAMLLLVLQSLPAVSQVKCKIEHYGTENGLSHNNVTDMLKSSDGFMWFATWDGINRFDGHNFVTYKAHQGDSMDLASNRINRLVEDYSGYLWLKPNDLSVCRFDKKTARLLSVSSILAKAKINNIKFDKIIPVAGEKVWLTTLGQGVFCVNNAASAAPVIDWYATGKEKKFALQSNTIKFVFEDKTRKIWIGTDKGLCVLSIDAKGNYYKNEHINPGNSDSAFTVIAETQNRIWLGTASGNIIYYEKTTGEFGNKKISAGAINALCVLKKNDLLYASTAAGEIIAINIFSVETEKNVIAGKTALLNIYEDRSGLLWIEPEKNGIIKYDPAIQSFKKFTQKSDAQLKYFSKQYGVFEDNEDRVWVMMANGGFGYYDPARDEVKYFYDEPGSPNHKFSNIIGARYFDRAGIFWFTTFDCGLEKIIFQQKDLDPKLLVDGTTDKYDNEVRGICNDHKNRMWIASKSGVLYIQQYDGKRLNNFFVNTPVDGIGSVYTILEDRKGRMWLGTKGNGLFVATALDSNATKFRLTHFMPDKNDPYSISSDIIYSLLEDKKGRIWLGTFDNGINLVKEHDNTIEFINSKNEFKDYPVAIAGRVRHLGEDAAGKLWIACNNSLVIADINGPDHKLYKFITYQKKTGDKTSLANNDVQYIFKDSKNRMWIGTSGGGLNEVVTEQNESLQFKAYTKNDGLPSDYILSIAEDNKGNLWLGTENGLCKFDPDKLLVRNYDTYDGLMKESFSEGTAARLSNGDLLFGTVSGYLVFDPEKVANKKVNASMVFTNLQINNNDVVAVEGSVLQTDINNTNTITLKYDQNIISIDFSILDYRSNNKQVFSYRLTGFDKGWNNVVSQHRATYTNLPPGNYVFEVKSLSENLYDKLPYKTLSITILPPWWRTWWAYLAYAVLLIIFIAIVRRVVTTMIRLRNKVVVEQKLTALKIKFFTNISHELRTPLTLIVNPVEELIKQPDIPSKWYHYLNIVHKNANRMVRFINQLLDFQKVQNKKMHLKIAETEMVSFVKDISSYFMEVANEKQIQLAVISNVDTLPAWIDAEKIDIVIYNLLSNAFKFSPGKTKIEAQLNYTAGDDMFVIKIIDQGPGVPIDKLNDIFELYFEVDRPGTDHLTGTGIGLALSKEIVQLHQGSIVAVNNTDRGLTVTVQLYISKDHFEQDNVTIITPQQSGALNTTTPDTALYPQPTLTEDAPANAAELPVVLIVDDNTELRKFLTGQLQPYYKIIEAANGKEALEKVNAFLPDLVLSDVMMPEMDGIALLDKLKNNETTSHIPVILLTAKSSVENQIEGINYGADYYITKPFSAPLIVALITNLLKQRKKIFKAILSGKKEITASKTNDTIGNEEISITDQDRTFLKEVIATVESNMSDIEFNIEKVASSMLMSRSTFYKKLKSLTNLSPVEFIKEIRLKHSKDLLDRGESDLAAIAYEVGFSNAKYFSACFKEEYNLTPKEYLKQKTENRAQF